MKKLKRLVTTFRIMVLLLLPCFSLAQDKVNHDVKPDTTEFTKSYSDKFKTKLLIGAGLHINNISPSSASPYYTAGGRSHTSFLPEISIGADLFTNPATAKIIFRLELSISGSQYRSTFNTQVEPYIGARASFDQIGFVVLPQVLYNFYNGANLKIYAGAGIALSLFKYSNVYYGPQNPNQSNVIFDSNPFDLKAFDDIFMIKAGAKIGERWGIFANYIASTYTTQAGYFSLTSSCKQVGLDYFFN